MTHCLDDVLQHTEGAACEIQEDVSDGPSVGTLAFVVLIDLDCDQDME